MNPLINVGALCLATFSFATVLMFVAFGLDATGARKKQALATLLFYASTVLYFGATLTSLGVFGIAYFFAGRF